MRNLSESEFDIKYQQYKDIVYNIAYSYVRNREDALDVSQDVFIKYLKSNDEFKTLDNEKYWLIRVTINTSKNYLSSSWKKKVTIDSEYLERISSDKKESVSYFNAIMNLPSKYKDVIVLFYYENLKLEEIAQTLNVSVSCVKKRLERGREKIKMEVEHGQL